jgi:hypothetical protein
MLASLHCDATSVQSRAGASNLDLQSLHLANHNHISTRCPTRHMPLHRCCLQLQHTSQRPVTCFTAAAAANSQHSSQLPRRHKPLLLPRQQLEMLLPHACSYSTPAIQLPCDTAAAGIAATAPFKVGGAQPASQLALHSSYCHISSYCYICQPAQLAALHPA